MAGRELVPRGNVFELVFKPGTLFRVDMHRFANRFVYLISNTTRRKTFDKNGRVYRYYIKLGYFDNTVRFENVQCCVGLVLWTGTAFDWNDDTSMWSYVLIDSRPAWILTQYLVMI